MSATDVPVEAERCNEQPEPFPSANSTGTTDEPRRWYDRLFHAVNGLYDGWYEGY